MTGKRVVFDTWAWWEVLRASAKGTRLKTGYLDVEGVRVYTSAISLGELAAKLASEGRSEDVPAVVSSLRGTSEIVDITGSLAASGGLLRAELRQRDPAASLADGVVLWTARQLGATLISAGPAFRGLPDVLDR